MWRSTFHSRIGQLDAEEARHQANLDAQLRAAEREARVQRAIEGRLAVTLPRAIPIVRDRRYDPIVPEEPTAPSAPEPPRAPETPPSVPPNGDAAALPGGVVSAAAPSIARTVGEVLLLTSPAWGAYLYTRFFG